MYKVFDGKLNKTSLALLHTPTHAHHVYNQTYNYIETRSLCLKKITKAIQGSVNDSSILLPLSHTENTIQII